MGLDLVMGRNCGGSRRLEVGGRRVVKLESCNYQIDPDSPDLPISSTTPGIQYVV